VLEFSLISIKNLTVRSTGAVDFYCGATAPSVPKPPIYFGLRSYSDTSHSVGLLWISDKPCAEISAWHHTTLTRDGHPCLLRDSNPQP